MMADPILRYSPPLVRGMPVFFAILRLASEMPKARFKEKLTPGIFIVIYIFGRGDIYFRTPFSAFFRRVRLVEKKSNVI